MNKEARDKYQAAINALAMNVLIEQGLDLISEKYKKLTGNTIDFGRPMSFDQSCRETNNIDPNAYVWEYPKDSIFGQPLLKNSMRAKVFLEEKATLREEHRPNFNE